MGEAPYKSGHGGVGALLSVSASSHERCQVYMFSNGDRLIVLKNLPIMLRCTALKIYLLCSTDAPNVLEHLQNP